MREQLRQRVVGILVLLALAAAFLPMVLDFSGEYPLDRTSQIPPPPHIEPIAIPEPSRVEGVAPGKGDEDIFQLDDSRKAAETATGPGGDAPPAASAPSNAGDAAVGLSAAGVPNAWVLQIGSFKDKARARAITDQLLADGYKAFVRAPPPSGDGLHRVYVGPRLRKDELAKEKAAIERKYKVKPMVLSFTP